MEQKIKAGELRLGNLIKSANQKAWPEIYGKTGIVTKIEMRNEKMYPDSDAVVGFGIGVTEYSQFIEFIEPIPLTEEWLVGFGLIELKNNSEGIIYGFVDENGWVYEDIKITYWRDKNEYFFLNRKIHLHDLQNIYHSHRGSELQFKQL